MIKLKNVSKYYYSKGVVATGITKVNLEFKIGEFVAITGESGSGKTTLLNVISGLDTYEDGEMYINGEETSHFITKDFEKYRRENIGNIYQNFNLINSYTVYQNIALVLMLNGVKNKEIKSKVYDLIEKVNLTKYRNTKVSKLSGGQKQRVAIARALAKDVPVIIADEPTGNLDKKSAEIVIRLLSELSKDKLVIIVTHNYEQVEPYVTRRITMHDGKVLEDRKIKDCPVINNYKKTNIKNISVFNKLRLGVRNTFNIVPKFILLFLVFSFIIVAVMGEYSLFKKEEYSSKMSGENYIFSDNSVNRIVVKKNDKSEFSEDDITNIKNMSNVDYVVTNDYLLDSNYIFASDDNEIYSSGKAAPLNIYKGSVDFGRLPENENEAIILVNKDDYYFSDDKLENSLNKNYYFLNNNSGEYINSVPIKIVGVKFKYDYSYEYTIYLSDSFLEPLKNHLHQDYSTVTVNFMGKNYGTDTFKLEINSSVPKGQVFMSEYSKYSCPNYNCLNQTLEVRVDNLYFSDKKTFTISKVFNEENIDKILTLNNYDKVLFYSTYNNCIYINPEDYINLFDKGSYQISVFVKDEEKLNITENELIKNNFSTLAIKDTLINNSDSTKIITVFKTITTLILVLTLFFISYFVIKIILKSRNIYYSTIRMLGGTKSATRQILMIELVTIAIISYIVFLIILYLNNVDVFSIGFLNDIIRYFEIKDYFILFLIIIGMAYLSSQRYSRKLFKDSVMTSFREEV